MEKVAGNFKEHMKSSSKFNKGYVRHLDAYAVTPKVLMPQNV